MNYGGRKMPAKCISVYIVLKKIDKCSKAIYTREQELNQIFCWFFFLKKKQHGCS